MSEHRNEPRTVTVEQARALLKGTTPGPWVSEYICDDVWTYLISGRGFEVARIVDGQGSEEIHDKNLIEAAPDLAHTVIALHEEVARLHRACAEGLPRGRIDCPRCGMRHIDGADSSEYGSRPHHTHLCQPENGGCGHVFDTGRWSYGADVASETDEYDALLGKLSKILTGVANALRGAPPPLAQHSHHDLAEQAAAVVAERDALHEENARLRAIVDNARAEREARVAWLESQPRDVGNGPVPDALLPLLEAELRTGLLIEELDEFDTQKGGAR